MHVLSVRSSRLILGVAALAGVAGTAASSYAAAITFGTVGALDPNDISAPGVPTSAATLTDAASNSTVGTGVTFSAFSALVATAYAAGNGGVVNFEGGGTVTQFAEDTSTNGTGTNAATVTLGALGTTSLTFDRLDGSAANYLDNASANGGGTQAEASGTQYLGIGGTSSPVTITFSTGLADLGLTMLARNALRYETISAAYSGISSGSITSSEENTNNTNQVFFGFAAPAGDVINSITLTSTSDLAQTTAAYARFDDLAVILPAATVVTPEPTSLGLLGLGGMALLRRRRA